MDKRKQVANTNALIKELWVTEDSRFYSDTTMKQDLRVEGTIFGNIDQATQAIEAQDFKVHKDLLVQDDATVKDHLHVEGLITATDLEITHVSHIREDSTVIGDMHVYDNLYVDGSIDVGGTVDGRDVSADGAAQDLHIADADIHRALDDDATSSVSLWSSTNIHDRINAVIERIGEAGAITEALDFHILNDLIVQDDATAKGDLYVEGDLRGISGLSITGVFTPGVDTFVAQDTTPDVSGGNVFKTANTDTTTVVDYDGGVEAQRITIIFDDNFTNIQDNNNVNLQGGVDFYGNSGDIIEFIYSGLAWYETNRSINS